MLKIAEESSRAAKLSYDRRICHKSVAAAIPIPSAAFPAVMVEVPADTGWQKPLTRRGKPHWHSDGRRKIT